ACGAWPIWACGSRAAGLIVAARAVPAGRTTTRRRAWWSRRGAAIWERAALWTQTNRISGIRSVIDDLRGVEEADQREGQRRADELHDDEHRRRRRGDPGEAVGKGAGDGDGGGGGAGGGRGE